MGRDQSLGVFRGERTRADQAHLAKQHVPELGNLIEAVLSQHRTEAGGPALAWVGFAGQRAQLENLKRAPPATRRADSPPGRRVSRRAGRTTRSATTADSASADSYQPR